MAVWRNRQKQKLKRIFSFAPDVDPLLVNSISVTGTAIIGVFPKHFFHGRIIRLRLRPGLYTNFKHHGKRCQPKEMEVISIPNERTVSQNLHSMNHCCDLKRQWATNRINRPGCKCATPVNKISKPSHKSIKRVTREALRSGSN